MMVAKQQEARGEGKEEGDVAMEDEEGSGGPLNVRIRKEAELLCQALKVRSVLRCATAATSPHSTAAALLRFRPLLCDCQRKMC